MKNFYEINIGNSERVVTVGAAASRELTISGRSAIVPGFVIEFIGELAEEVERQQKRKTATDAQIEERIDQRVDQVLKALDAHGLLKMHLSEQYPLPKGVESPNGSWSVLSEARAVAKGALRNESGNNLVEDIGGQSEKSSLVDMLNKNKR